MRFWYSGYPALTTARISCREPLASGTATAPTNGMPTWTLTRECSASSWGWGTKAVDRTGEDYPRLANLDRPAATVLTTDEQRHKFSQRHIDVLDCETNRLCEVPLSTLLPLLPDWYKSMFWNTTTMRKTACGRPGVTETSSM